MNIKYSTLSFVLNTFLINRCVAHMLMVSNVSSTSNVDYINMNISSMDSGSDGNHKGFLLMIHVIQEIPNIYSENIFTILRNKHSTPLILINKTINFCEFMVDKSKNLFLQSFFDEENGQYPNGCPVKKNTYYVPLKTYNSDFLPNYMTDRKLIIQSNVHCKIKHTRIPVMSMRVVAEIKKVAVRKSKHGRNI